MSTGPSQPSAVDPLEQLFARLDSQKGQETAAPAGPAPAADGTPPPVPSPDADQERDIWWGAYHSWTMIPSLLVCLAATAALAALAWWLSDLFRSQAHFARNSVYAVMGALWLVQIIRWVYRITAFTYRLTTQRLYHDYGPLYPRPEPVELSRIAHVRIEQSWLERSLDVGTLRLLVTDNSTPPLALDGVPQPRRIAAAIEQQAQLARRRKTARA